MQKLFLRLFPALFMFRVAPEEGPGPDDMRADLEAALDDPEAPVEAGPSSPAEDGVASDGRSRDPLGRFAPKDGESPPADAAAAARAQQVADQTSANQQAMRPPASWKPEARETWSALPPAAQAEISRRESEMARAMTETAGARQFAENMTQIIAPYMPMIQADGGNPFTAVQNLFQTAATLRTGTPADKARLVAEIVGSFGVDVGLLDSALAGVPLQQQGGADPAVLSEVQRLLDQRLAPVQQIMSAAQQRAARQDQEARGHAQAEIERFAADPKNEFFSDVRDIMADLVEVAHRHGRDMPLESAYRQACQLHPDVAKVMLARSTSTSAQRLTAAAQRARAAAVSVSGAPIAGPAGEATPADDSIRSHIEAAMAANSR